MGGGSRKKSQRHAENVNNTGKRRLKTIKLRIEAKEGG